MTREIFKHEPTVVGRDLGATDPRQTGPHALSHRERIEQERQAGMVQTMAMFQQMTAHLGGILDELVAPPINDVLFSGSVECKTTRGTTTNPTTTFSLFTTMSWTIPYASVFVANVSTGTIIVAQGALVSGVPPRRGAGVFRLAQDYSLCVPMRGNDLTIYANHEGPIHLAVFSRPREPSASTVTTS